MQLDARDLDADHLALALDHLRDVFAIFDDRDRLVYWNAHAQRRSGYTAEELAGMDPAQLVAADDLPKLAAYLREVRTTGRSTVEVRLVSKRGEEVAHELYSDRLTVADGTFLGRVVVGRDVSERLAYERILEHKNERLAEFARFVSHDIRSPLAVAGGCLARYRETGDEDAYRQVVAAHRRIEEIVDDLLGMTAAAADPVADAAPVAVETVAHEAWLTVRSDAATLRVADAGEVVADAGLFRQALENLFHNAVQHGGEDVTVRVGRLSDGGLVVEDDGPGFPAGESVFEAGVTTRPEGTGLGLAIVDEIAAMHGWSVEATVGDGGGARVEFRGVDR